MLTAVKLWCYFCAVNKIIAVMLDKDADGVFIAADPHLGFMIAKRCTEFITIKLRLAVYLLALQLNDIMLLLLTDDQLLSFIVIN